MRERGLQHDIYTDVRVCVCVYVYVCLACVCVSVTAAAVHVRDDRSSSKRGRTKADEESSSRREIMNSCGHRHTSPRLQWS